MINQVYDAYDIHLNSLNELMIAKYKVYDENVEGKNGKVQTYRRFQYVGVEVPKDIKERLIGLNQEGFLPRNKFGHINFEVETSNPFVYAKLMLLGFQHQILEKYYTLDDTYLKAYITYINMITGEVNTMEVGRFNSYDNAKERLLEDSGFIPKEYSFYYQNQERDTELKR